MSAESTMVAKKAPAAGSAISPGRIGAHARIRTGDLFLTKYVLYPLVGR
jgi:hypothetical protein